MLKQVVKKAGLVGLLAGGALVGVNTYAETDEYMVAYSNAELTSPKGVEDVHARIVRAAKRYCPSYSQIRSVREVESCVADVVEDLVSKVDHPQLTSLHESGSSVSVAAATGAADDRG